VPSGGWVGSDRGSRLPSDWPLRRGRVRRRARGRCEWVDESGRCQLPGTDCDHIVPGDDHDLGNLQWLCRWHHAHKSAMEGVAARPVLAPRRRPPESHPGLL